MRLSEMKHEEISQRPCGCVATGQELRTGVPDEELFSPRLFSLLLYEIPLTLLSSSFCHLEYLRSLNFPCVVRTVQLAISIDRERPGTTLGEPLSQTMFLEDSLLSLHTFVIFALISTQEILVQFFSDVLHSHCALLMTPSFHKFLGYFQIFFSQKKLMFPLNNVPIFFGNCIKFVGY